MSRGVNTFLVSVLSCTKSGVCSVFPVSWRECQKRFRKGFSRVLDGALWHIVKALTSCTKKSRLFLSILSAFFVSYFPYCSENSVQAWFWFVFPHTSYLYSHWWAPSTGTPAHQEEVIVLLVPVKCCSFPAQVACGNLFVLSFNTFVWDPAEGCLLPTKGVEVDILVALADGRHGNRDVQVYVCRLPRKCTEGCLCQPYLRLMNLLLTLFHFS